MQENNENINEFLGRSKKIADFFIKILEEAPLEKWEMLCFNEGLSRNIKESPWITDDSPIRTIQVNKDDYYDLKDIVLNTCTSIYWSTDERDFERIRNTWVDRYKKYYQSVREENSFYLIERLKLN